MRIVGGRHRGRRIEAPEGSAVRPTSDRAREAVFNILENGRTVSETGFVLPGSVVLDAFCGSGALGLEALSRGADVVTFLDRDPDSLAAARTNAETLGEAERCAYLDIDVANPPTARRRHTLAFLDPPYGKGLVVPALSGLAAQDWLADGALCVVEHGSDEARDDPPAGFEVIEARRYGAAAIDFIRYRATPD